MFIRGELDRPKGKDNAEKCDLLNSFSSINTHPHAIARVGSSRSMISRSALFLLLVWHCAVAQPFTRERRRLLRFDRLSSR